MLNSSGSPVDWLWVVEFWLIWLWIGTVWRPCWGCGPRKAWDLTGASLFVHDHSRCHFIHLFPLLVPPLDLLVWKDLKLTFKNTLGTSLVAQWLGFHLPMQGTRVWTLVREDPTCCGATKPVRHNYWACVWEPASHNYWSPRAYSPCSATREATAMRSLHTTMKSSPRSPQLEKANAQQRSQKTPQKTTH